MKKGFLISFIISFIFLLGLFVPINPKTDFSNSKISSFDKFEQNIVKELQNDDYSYTEIDKNTTLNNLQQKLNLKQDHQITTFALENKPLTSNQIKEFCALNDLIVVESETTFQIRNKFSLKRLIVADTLSSNYGARTIISGYDNIKILCFNSIEETKSAYSLLISEGKKVTIDSVITAESDEFVKAQAIYDDWGKTAINLSAYTDYNTTKQIVVAVLDTGINTSHEMFDNRLLYNNGKIVGLSYYSSNYSYSKNNLHFESTDTSKLSFEDDHGHGSHVAGIITQLTPSNVKILPIRILGSDGKGALSSITTALGRINTTYSNTYHIACNNLSLGGEVNSDFEEELNAFETIFTTLKNKNILNIVAAGNEASTTANFIPAACEDSAIVVSALKQVTNEEGTKITGYAFDDSYSNYGTSVDICAPGTQITSAYKASYNSANATDQYHTMNGTSMATPHVSACITLLCLDNDYYSTPTSTPTYTASELENRILNSAVDYGDQGKDIYYGHGVLSMTNINVIKNISYTASDTTATYDGNYHNIDINVTQPSTYSIKYSLENDSTYTISNYKTISTFKNATNGAIPVYFQITARGFRTVTGVKYLTINKRKLSIRLYNQTTPHTIPLSFNGEDYDFMSGTIVNGDELDIELFTNATALSFAGNYELMAKYNNENYDITFTQATLTIEFSYVDVLIIVVPIVVLILVAIIILVVVIKRKNKTIPLYKKWTK